MCTLVSGSLVNGVLKLARAEQQAYGCVEVKYDPEVRAMLNVAWQAVPVQVCRACSLSQVIPRHDLVLNFSEHGFHLCFDSTTQSMRMIEVHDFSRVQVSLRCARTNLVLAASATVCLVPSVS